MAVTVETIELPNFVFAKKFTTNLSAGTGQDSTTWTCPADVESVRYLVVAGGGGVEM